MEPPSPEEEEEELEVQEQHDDGSSSDEQDNDEADDASSSSSENNEDEDEDALQADGYGDEDSDADGDGASDDGSEGGEDDDASGDERGQKQIYTGDETCTLDLRNLTAINSHQVNTATLYKQQADTKKKGKKKKKKAAEDDLLAAMGDKVGATIPPIDLTTIINEDQLLETAREGCQQILKGLWSLDSEKTDAGPMGVLPQQFEIKTPRELPPPPPKQETKWEKFAKERGIPTNKEKRSRKVWDEAAGTWMYRHGYQKANDSTNTEWPIMEVKRNDDPYADPWESARDAKRARVDKNTENRMRNMERAGRLAKGTTTRTLKDKTRAREAGKAGGGSMPSGIPVDMVSSKQRGKNLTKAALIATQRSTASLGKFDMMREGEPERKKAMAGLKKRKFESGTDRKFVKTEANRNAKVLDQVMKGGGVDKQKAIRRGEFAKGETAYDYEYNDGSNHGYKKKKGRAGAGKMRKVTKARAK